MSVKTLTEIRIALATLVQDNWEPNSRIVRDAIEELAELRQLTQCQFFAVTHAGAPIVPGVCSTYQQCSLRAGHTGDCEP